MVAKDKAKTAEAVAGLKKALQETADEDSDAPEAKAPWKGLTKLTVEELRAKYVEVLQRPTSSTNASYLVWKIRMAMQGKVPTGERKASRQAGCYKVLPTRMEVGAVEAMDATWREMGWTSRQAFITDAINAALGGVVAQAPKAD